MSDVAVIGCVAAALWTAAVGQARAQLQGESVAGHPYQRASEDKRFAQPWPLSWFVSKPNDPNSAEEACARGDSNCYTEEDVKAQRRMANAAESQLYLLSWQTFVTALESGLLIATVVFTFFAARAANRSAGAAEKSAETIPRAERAYIFFHPLSDNFEGALFSDIADKYLKGLVTTPTKLKKPTIKIQFSNLGKTPAALIEIRVGLRHMEKPPAADGYLEHSRASLRQPAISGTSDLQMDIPHKQAVAVGELALLETKARSYYVQGRVLYRTLFDQATDEPKETTFCWRYNFRKRRWAEHGGTDYNRRT